MSGYFVCFSGWVAVYLLPAWHGGAAFLSAVLKVYLHFCDVFFFFALRHWGAWLQSVLRRFVISVNDIKIFLFFLKMFESPWSKVDHFECNFKRTCSLRKYFFIWILYFTGNLVFNSIFDSCGHQLKINILHAQHESSLLDLMLYSKLKCPSVL